MGESGEPYSSRGFWPKSRRLQAVLKAWAAILAVCVTLLLIGLWSTVGTHDFFVGALIALFWLIALTFAGVLYFVPTIVASRRRHRNGQAVFVINLFMGWTLIGWTVALAWAVMDQSRK